MQPGVVTDELNTPLTQAQDAEALALETQSSDSDERGEQVVASLEPSPTAWSSKSPSKGLQYLRCDARCRLGSDGEISTI